MKIKQIIIIFLFVTVINACGLFSDPECELISYKTVEPIDSSAIFVRLEVENVSEDYAYGVTCLVKAYKDNSIQQVKGVQYGTMKAGEILESKAYLDSLDNFDNTDKLIISLKWYGETDATYAKDYEYVLNQP